MKIEGDTPNTQLFLYLTECVKDRVNDRKAKARDENGLFEKEMSSNNRATRFRGRKAEGDIVSLQRKLKKTQHKEQISFPLSIEGKGGFPFHSYSFI